jgi:hypothetical protein
MPILLYPIWIICANLLQMLKALGEIGYDGWATSEVSGPPPATADKLWVNSGERELADIAARMKRVLGVRYPRQSDRIGSERPNSVRSI